MALKAQAKYMRGISKVRFMPHCGNGTFPGAQTGVFGGQGPFDFTAAHAVISAVPIKLKLDNGAELSDTLDLSTYTETAVTAANFVTAFTASSVGGGWTASVDATTGRLKIVNSGGTYAQVYGKAAELAGFGRGIGAQFVKTDTLENINVLPVKKEDTRDAVTDANNNETVYIEEGYYTGASGNAVDTAIDYYMMRLMSGGPIDSDGAFSLPNSNSVRPYFAIEIYNPYFGEGANKKGEIVGYQKTTVFNAMGALGDDARGAGWKKGNYSYTAETYKTAAGVETTAVKYEDLTVAEFNALDFDNV